MGEIKKIRVSGVDYDINGIYPTQIEANIQTVSEMATIEQKHHIGDIEQTNATSVTTVAPFWITDVMAPIIGKKLVSITINAASSGIISFSGNNELDVDKTLSDVSSLAQASAALTNSSDTFTMFSLQTDYGIATYYFDGTDSRVTIHNQEAIDSCPKTIGIGQKTDTAVFKYNKGNLTNKGQTIFVHDALAGTSLEESRTSGLGFYFTYLDTVPVESFGGEMLSMTLSNGTNIQADLTELFNNRLSTSGKLAGKKISFLGDSITTFRGHIPNGYAAYYPSGDIQSVEQTWWYQLVNETGMQLVRNASWSGSTVTGNSSSTTSAAAGCSTARINDLASADKPEIIVIYIGINDFALSSHRELGNYDGSTAIPSEGNITTFSEAYGLMVSKVLKTYPKARVFCCTLLETAHGSYDTGENATYPTINNNGTTLSEFNNRIKLIASNLGAGIIDLHTSGIHYWNLADNTTDKLHPNVQGAIIIKDFIKNALINQL